MKRKPGVVSFIAVLLLVVASEAQAACAWVLWVKGKGSAGWYGNWAPISAFASLKECDGIRMAGYEEQYSTAASPTPWTRERRSKGGKVIWGTP